MTVDLSNPDFEPTDEQLAELSRRAFAGVKERHQHALEELHRRIAVERQRVLVQWQAEHPTSKP